MRNQNELMHHSVKGIKWGVRKKQKVSGRQIRREYRDSIRRNHKQIKKDIPFYRPYKRELARIEKDASSAEKIVRKYGNLRGGSAVARQDAIDSLGSTLKKTVTGMGLFLTTTPEGRRWSQMIGASLTVVAGKKYGEFMRGKESKRKIAIGAGVLKNAIDVEFTVR